MRSFFEPSHSMFLPHPFLSLVHQQSYVQCISLPFSCVYHYHHVNNIHTLFVTIPYWGPGHCCIFHVLSIRAPIDTYGPHGKNNHITLLQNGLPLRMTIVLAV